MDRPSGWWGEARHVPGEDGAVLAAGVEALAIGRKDSAGKRAEWAGELAEFLAGVGVQKRGHFLVRLLAQCQYSPVRRKGQRPALRQDEPFATRGGFPDARLDGRSSQVAPHTQAH